MNVSCLTYTSFVHFLFLRSQVASLTAITLHLTVLEQTRKMTLVSFHSAAPMLLLLPDTPSQRNDIKQIRSKLFFCGNYFLSIKICVKCLFKNRDKCVLLAPCLTGHLMRLSFSNLACCYVRCQIKVTISGLISWELAGVHSDALKTLK